MSKTEPALLHFAEERSQSRAQDLRELWVVVIKCAFKALGMSALWGTVVTGVRLLLGDHVSVLSAVLTYGVVWVIWFGLRLEGDIDRHDESLCSERRAETYAPPQPKPELPAPADSPFMVHPYGDKDPYMLHRDGRDHAALAGRTSGGPGFESADCGRDLEGDHRATRRPVEPGSPHVHPRGRQAGHAKALRKADLLSGRRRVPAGASHWGL